VKGPGGYGQETSSPARKITLRNTITPFTKISGKINCFKNKENELFKSTSIFYNI